MGQNLDVLAGLKGQATWWTGSQVLTHPHFFPKAPHVHAARPSANLAAAQHLAGLQPTAMRRYALVAESNPRAGHSQGMS